ncbi:M23 family metallopeptidase [Alteromonas flava]|uniref:M23 family metallopeptidase n=1 Tax=Alteromonas flava TaxID=2048003 RepID=UPI000C291861|nr:M23 family metallopeptidase [Alteromonas flava]
MFVATFLSSATRPVAATRLQRHSLLLALFYWLFSSASLAADCFDGWFCVDRESRSGRLQLYNQTQYPVVVTINASWRTSNGVQELEKTVNLLSTKPVTIVQFESGDAKSLARLRYSVQWAGGRLNAKHDPNTVYYYPFAAKQAFTKVQGFGGAFSHTGASRYAVDFAVPVGTPIHAARDGIVIDTEASHTRGGSSRRYARYANYIVILHNDGTTGEYHHLQHRGVEVNRGDRVSAGQLIGYSGNTGFSSLPHLHFAVYRPLSHGNYESLPFRFIDDQPR